MKRRRTSVDYVGIVSSDEVDCCVWLIHLHFGSHAAAVAKQLLKREASLDELGDQHKQGLAKLVEMDFVVANANDQFLLDRRKVFCSLLRSHEYHQAVTNLHGVKGVQLLSILLQKGPRAIVNKDEFDWLDELDGLEVLEEAVFVSQLQRMYQAEHAHAPALAGAVREVLSVCGPGVYREGSGSFAARDVLINREELVALQQRNGKTWLVEDSEGVFSLSLLDALAEPVERMVKEAVEQTSGIAGAGAVFGLLATTGATLSKDFSRKVLLTEAETRRILNKLLVDGWVRAVTSGAGTEKKHVHHSYQALGMVEAARLLLQREWSTLLRVLVKLSTLHDSPNSVERSKLEFVHGKAEEIFSSIVILKKFVKMN